MPDDDIVNVVTILILIDGFLQYYCPLDIKAFVKGHNPYFNRWFSAMEKQIRCYYSIR